VDVAFVCDTYHHFEYPFTTLASIHAALRPGGELIIVDFKRIEGESREWVMDHVRAGQDEVTNEVTSAGFERVEELKVDGLEENYMLRFRKRQ
jgi:predicted methyltransferase